MSCVTLWNRVTSHLYCTIPLLGGTQNFICHSQSLLHSRQGTKQTSRQPKLIPRAPILQVHLPRPFISLQACPAWGPTQCYCEDTHGQSTKCLQGTASVMCKCLSCRSCLDVGGWGRWCFGSRSLGLGESIPHDDCDWHDGGFWKRVHMSQKKCSTLRYGQCRLMHIRSPSAKAALIP